MLHIVYSFKTVLVL